MDNQPIETNNDPQPDRRPSFKKALLMLPLMILVLLAINFLFSPISWFNQEFMPPKEPAHTTFAFLGTLFSLVFMLLALRRKWPTLIKVFSILFLVSTLTNLGALSMKGLFPRPISLFGGGGVYEVASSTEINGKTYSLVLPVNRNDNTGKALPVEEISNANTQSPDTWFSRFKARVKSAWTYVGDKLKSAWTYVGDKLKPAWTYVKDMCEPAVSWFAHYIYPGPGLKLTTPIYIYTDSPLPAGAKYITIEDDGLGGKTVKAYSDKIDSK